MFNFILNFFRPKTLDMGGIAFGANHSAKKISDIKAEQLDMAVATPTSLSLISNYSLPLVNQRAIGICTSADLIDMAQAHFGKVFSMRFNYNGQKKIYDKNTIEGSSNQVALAFAKNFGFLPIEFDIAGNDTSVSHSEFLNINYTAEQFAEAKKYADAFTYAVVDDLSPNGFAQAMAKSKYGLMTRMSVGDNFFTPSWAKRDLELLRDARPLKSGHSVKVVEYAGLDGNQIRTMRNSWGGIGNPTSGNTIWSDDGYLKYIYVTQAPYVTEAHLVIFGEVKFKHIFNVNISYGQKSDEVTALQRVLVQMGFLTMPAGVAMGYYGNLTAKAVLDFQKAKNVAPVAVLEQLAGRNVGPSTRLALNNNQ